MTFEAERAAARDVDVADIADAIESIGFECTRCGHCCRGLGEAEHTATVFPDEIREIQREGADNWRDVARPMPFGLSETDGEPTTGETFEWALQTDACGDCTFYDDENEACSIYDRRPLICRTYPFSLSIEDEGDGTTSPMGSVVDRAGPVHAHECEGLGRDISREDAEELAATLKRRAIREREEAIGVRDNYEPRDVDGVVVHDSEGQKRPDGTPISE
ncbi:YkgJ family cysteine cluster protein [Halorhabdus sp. BNX81]|uniref:YkgJ family cysteine cluster protein n=1 Tax=Halorhabdus sp. BNX81 TaxID=2980181 RepID=UPI0023DCF48D|nr:YkgJ family cysteine cluster protein [Halorhabdus sp. BNX81]WEL21715.1 Fe-S-cluster containining protein [Halorhabdus sp. BNX81]